MYGNLESREDVLEEAKEYFADQDESFIQEMVFHEEGLVLSYQVIQAKLDDLSFEEVKNVYNEVTYWVTALEEGGYKQGRKCLLNEEGKFCCLGVLTELQKDVEWADDEVEKSIKLGKVFKEAPQPPLLVKKRVLDDATDGRFFEMLAALNDGGLTFEEIAKVIRFVFAMKEG